MLLSAGLQTENNHFPLSFHRISLCVVDMARVAHIHLVKVQETKPRAGL